MTFQRQRVAVAATLGDAAAQPVGGVVHREAVEQRGRDDLAVGVEDRDREVGRLHGHSKRLRRRDDVRRQRAQVGEPFEVGVAVVGLCREVRDPAGRGELRRVMQSVIARR